MPKYKIAHTARFLQTFHSPPLRFVEAAHSAAKGLPTEVAPARPVALIDPANFPVAKPVVAATPRAGQVKCGNCSTFRNNVYHSGAEVKACFAGRYAAATPVNRPLINATGLPWKVWGFNPLTLEMWLWVALTAEMEASEVYQVINAETHKI